MQTVAFWWEFCAAPSEQKYRVQHHIVPYVDQLRAEIAQLKAAGTSAVSAMSSGVEKLSLGEA